MEHSFGLRKLNSRALAVIAGMAILLAACLTLTGNRPDSASAAAGGLGMTSYSPPAKSNSARAAVRGTRFGTRVLRVGASGPDVRVLKGILRRQRLLAGTTMAGYFDRATARSVRRFQRKKRIARSGVVNRRTARSMIRSLPISEASWYGPGLYGNGTACGKVTLRPRTIGIAHKHLPCGSRVMIGYRGRYVIAPVIDRGPYIAGRTWDLTAAAARAVGLTGAGIGRVRHAVLFRKR